MFSKVSAMNGDELNPKDPTFLIDTISTVLFAQAKEHGWMPGVDYNYMLGKSDLSCYNLQFQKLICCLQDFHKVEKIKTDLIYIVNSDMDMHVVKDRGLQFIEQCRHYRFNRDDIIQPYLYDSMTITLDRLIKAKLNSSWYCYLYTHRNNILLGLSAVGLGIFTGSFAYVSTYYLWPQILPHASSLVSTISKFFN